MWQFNFINSVPSRAARVFECFTWCCPSMGARELSY
nr:MAG TPA: hypothetical protein [Caudoviricetes sp.]